MLSVIICFYNNQREARNTLYSLSRQYQRDIQDIEYEVIVLDHGSSSPIPESEVKVMGKEFKYYFIKDAPVSPVIAINNAARESLGERLIVMIDGAHLITPGVFKYNLDAYLLSDAPFVAVPALHLGPEKQNLSVVKGYNQKIEDELLQSSAWKENGYELFKIANAFSDDGNGWFGNLFETSCFGMYKKDFLRLGGLNESFISPGGGLISLDFFKTCMSDKRLDYFMLLGEASFHQFHGGVASNAPLESHPWKNFHNEYYRIHGHNFERCFRKPFFLGALQTEPIAAMNASTNDAFQSLHNN